MAKINHMISTSKAKSSLYFTSHLSFWVDHFGVLLVQILEIQQIY